MMIMMAISNTTEHGNYTFSFDLPTNPVRQVLYHHLIEGELKP